MIDVVDRAISMLSGSSTPHLHICKSSAYWIPLHWLYERAVFNKDLDPISKAGNNEKQKYWDLVLDARPDRKDKFFRISLCQALYVYDKIVLQSK